MSCNPVRQSATRLIRDSKVPAWSCRPGSSMPSLRVCVSTFDFQTAETPNTSPTATSLGNRLGCRTLHVAVCWQVLAPEIRQLSPLQPPGGTEFGCVWINCTVSISHIRSSSGTTSTHRCTMSTDLQWLLLRVSPTCRSPDKMLTSLYRTTTPSS